MLPPRLLTHTSSNVLTVAVVAVPVVLVFLATLLGWVLFPFLPADRRRDLTRLATMLLKILVGAARLERAASRSQSGRSSN